MTNSSITPKVLFLNPWDRFIGPNRYLVEMLRQLPELAANSLIVFHVTNNALKEYEALGCRVAVWSEVAPIRAQLTLRNLVMTAYRQSIGLMKVIRRIRAQKPDLIISNTENLWLGGLSSRMLKIPHWQILHAITFAYRLGSRPRVMRAYLRGFSLLSSKLIAVSETLRQALIQGGIKNDKVVTLPNPINVEELANSSTLPTALKDKLACFYPILISAGRICHLKGQDQLIETLPQIRKVLPRVLCLFVGQVGDSSGWEDTNQYFSTLKKRLDELDLREHVLFLGEVDYLPGLLQKADVYIQTSRTESFGRVVAEALVCQTPVVTFDAGALAEVAGPGAIVVKNGDVQGLARAVVRLVSNPEERTRLAKAGSTHVGQSYDSKKAAREFSEALATIIGSRKTTGTVQCAG
jgi:glycosyltransferase involved in cell wall biosynthesis